MATVLQPAVAGTFYPLDSVKLRNVVKSFLSSACNYSDKPVPRAIIAPHAGYIYSGRIAASAFACLDKTDFQRVIIISPAHRYLLKGIAVPTSDVFLTPLGAVAIDKKCVASLLRLHHVNLCDAAFKQEHAIEVQLPFFQVLLPRVKLIPVLVGKTKSIDVVKVLDKFIDDNKTLIVISSDLSHYHSYFKAQQIDKMTVKAILELLPEYISGECACGYKGIQAILEVAKRKDWKAKLICSANSGDTAGSKDRVVGYAAIHFNERNSH